METKFEHVATNVASSCNF